MTQSGEKDPKTLVSKLFGLKELEIRKVKVVEILRHLDPDRGATLIDYLIKGTIDGDEASSSAYLALIRNRSIEGMVGGEKTRAIFDSASRMGMTRVLELLKSWSMRRQAESDTERSPLSLKLANLTLGEKKALARRRDYRHLEFLLFDNNPAVISNVLKNPKLTEREVIRVASNRGAPLPVLEEVFKSDKWIKRYRVRKALVFNGTTPLDITLSLCSSLLRQDLKLIARSGNLDPSLVRKAKEVLGDKE